MTSSSTENKKSLDGFTYQNTLLEDENQNKEPEQKAKWYNWFEPGTSSKEKRLIIKLDFFIMSYSMMAFFMKYLDQTNISNAYVSGMKEDLNLNSNQLSWFNTYFNIGTCIGSIPAVLFAGYFRPRYFLPIMDLLWSLCVLFIYKAKNAETIYALRFLIGFFESSCNPSTHYMIGCWYKKREIMRRSNFFVIAGVVGQATSSYIQSGLHSSMDGKRGLAAWQWLFIFDAIIGIPVIIYGFLFLPDYPHNTTSFYLNDWEKKRVKERMVEDGRVEKQIEFNLKHVKSVLCSWQLWVFCIGYCFWTLTAASYMLQFFQLYLKSLKTYSVSYINNFPTILSGVNLVTMLSTGVICDLTGRRDLICLVVGTIVLVAFIITAKGDLDNIPLRKAGYILSGAYGCFTPILSGWANISCGKNPILRAVTIPAMVVVGQAVVTPYQQNLFPSSEAPTYDNTNGFYYAIGFTCCLTIWCGFVIPFFEKKYGHAGEMKVDENDNDIKRSTVPELS